MRGGYFHAEIFDAPSDLHSAPRGLEISSPLGFLSEERRGVLEGFRRAKVSLAGFLISFLLVSFLTHHADLDH